MSLFVSALPITSVVTMSSVPMTNSTARFLIFAVNALLDLYQEECSGTLSTKTRARFDLLQGGLISKAPADLDLNPILDTLETTKWMHVVVLVLMMVPWVKGASTG